MSNQCPPSPPKRPRLSLQIKTFASGPSGRVSRGLAAAVDVKSPTAFNTLSNVYATAVDRSTPVQEKPPAHSWSGKPTLRLQTQDAGTGKDARLHTPYSGPYLDTPLTAQPVSPAVSMDVYFPSTMTATPPLSAIPPEQNGARVFTFETQATPVAAQQPSEVPQSAAQTPRRRTTLPSNLLKLPYTHPRSLHSILRNSPLPPLSTKSPVSPRRQSLRLQEKAARRVAYNSPLCQTITTSRYIKSHIDLLTDDATPTTPSTSDDDVLDQTMAYTGNETRDGGQTPGPFEEMRRRMTTMRASTPITLSPTGGGIRKRGKKREKKRRWVWTIGQDGEETDEAGSPVVDMSERVSLPKKEPVAVPVIALPSPRPRTRMQMARAGASQVPVIAVPTPPTPSAPPIIQVPAYIANDVRPTTPTQQEPVAVAEPPTPSVDSIASLSQDSVFEASGDVDMSDASSVFSEWDDVRPVTGIMYPSPGLGVDMDMDTPTTAVKTVFAAEIQGLVSMDLASGPLAGSGAVSVWQ
ncbi:hypothetical protein B0T17DRAFT_611663 [Bombardia bombarda]|uniref:Uncharacterized protein n=1 Tax=Bombardia bombarda TaxID=252184 RepID=A0AA39XIL5_9PEZI|nr:hypothetical protein B0T17DRAFT_611663 [Bombardia bombarda]